jgi:hypothetical protein
VTIDQDFEDWRAILRRNPPLTFADLDEGDVYLSFPLPGDDAGHGGFRGTNYLFKKLTPTGSMRIIDDVSCSCTPGMLVLRVR